MKTIKTISKVTTIIAFVAFANVVLAAGNLKVNILPLNSERAVVAISNIEESKFQISIQDTYGNILFYKETEKQLADYSKVYDFSQLEQGDYSLTVGINGEKIKREFTINNKAISVGKPKSVIDPYFAYQDGVLKVSFLNFDESAVSINFYQNSDLIYQKESGEGFNISEGFDVSKLQSGNYAVTLSNGSNDYSYDFAVK